MYNLELGPFEICMVSKRGDGSFWTTKCLKGGMWLNQGHTETIGQYINFM